jgi:predicted metal-dependent phosphoesterase TrpH
MRIDTHTHTYYSPDAISSPEDIVRAAKSKGLEGIALTDHNTTMGWKRTLEAGKKQKLGIILGEEIKVTHQDQQIGEVIGLFLNDEIKPGEFHDVRAKIKEQGGIMIAAHPFDALRNAFKLIEEFKRHFNAIEVLNSRTVLDRFNRKALEFAKNNKIAMTAGSDGHCSYEIGKAYTIADIDDVKGLRNAIKREKTSVGGGRSNPLIHLVSTFAKTGLVGRE